MTKRRKRRIRSDDEKRMICEQTRVPVSQVAQRDDVNAHLVFAWLRNPRFADGAASDVVRFLPVEIAAERRRRRWQVLSPTVASRSTLWAVIGCGSAVGMIPRHLRGRSGV